MSTHLECEQTIPQFVVDGVFDTWEAQPERVTNVIRTTQKWGVKFNWTQSGPLCWFLDAKWHLRISLERFGPGEAPDIAEKVIDLVREDPHTYTGSVDIEANTMSPGDYELVAALTMTNREGNIPLPLGAYGEGPVIHIYDPGPLQP